MCLFKKDVIKSYEALVRKQQKLMDEMSNVGREKDYRVQKIEKKYNSKIDNLVRSQQAIALQVEISKRYVNDVNCDNSDIIKKVNTNNKKREA
jgi:hypothetical protein